jgi:hypothetical protein
MQNSPNVEPPDGPLFILPRRDKYFIVDERDGTIHGRFNSERMANLVLESLRRQLAEKR